MIPTPRGWSRRAIADTSYFYPPEGTAVGGLAYRERVPPLRRAREVLDELLARHRDIEPLAVGPIERLITLEGEYAAAVTVSARAAGRPVQRDLGLVFGDDHLALVSALCFEPEQFARFRATVRELVLRDRQMLGVRRRRIVYDPPAAWQPLCRGLQTDWFPPDYPARPCVITVMPALPLRPGLTPSAAMDALVADERARGASVLHLSPGDAASTARGLQGQAFELITQFSDGARSFRDIVLFSDDRYFYNLRLEVAARAGVGVRAAARETFAALVRSAWPIPRPDEAKPDGAAAAAWSD